MIGIDVHNRQFFTFKLGQYLCGIDIQMVREVLRHQATTRIPLAPAVVMGLINLRGQILTVIDLRIRLGLKARSDGHLPVNIVVSSDNHREDGNIALLVDEVGDVIEVESTTCEPPPESINGSIRDLITTVCKTDKGLMHIVDIGKACRMD